MIENISNILITNKILIGNSNNTNIIANTNITNKLTKQKKQKK